MIPIHKPDLGDEEARAAGRVIRGGWVTQGPEVERFERAVADYCSAADAVATSSGTAALCLSLVAAGIGAGDEVICPSLSFIATANSICHAGAVPRFAEVDPRTYNLDPDAAEAAVTPRCRAVMVVHQMGLPADVDRFLAIGRSHGLLVIEDAACALGSRYRGQPIGGHGALTCFSFHPRKVITTGEGGMIVTNDRKLAGRLRRLRNHGVVPNGLGTQGNRWDGPLVPCCEELGYNYRMSDVHATIGLAQMPKLDGLIRRRRELAARYAAALAAHPYLRPPWIPDYATPNFQSYAVSLTDDAPLARDALVRWLRDRGVGAGPGIMLAHRQKAHRGYPGAESLPRSEAAHDRSLLLPLYPQLAESQQDHVVGLLWKAFSLDPGSKTNGR